MGPAHSGSRIRAEGGTVTVGYHNMQHTNGGKGVDKAVN